MCCLQLHAFGFSTIPISLVCCRLVVGLAHSCQLSVGRPLVVAVAGVGFLEVKTVVILHLVEVVVGLRHRIPFVGGISCIFRICRCRLPVV